LVFAGGGPEEKKLKAHIKKLKLDDNVCVTGYLERPQIARFFGAAEVFTFPSVTETQGLVLCEAMAGGTAVVAINLMGPKDIITSGVNGYLTKNNETDFTQKIIKLLDDQELREEFTKNGLKNVRKFSIAHCSNRLIEIYQKTIAAHAYTQKK
jgi:glycosyltransferase involved in cell wall biosynthesis